jgi:general stress protein YciG
MTLSAVAVRRSRRLKGRANKTGVSANHVTIDHAVSLHTRKRVRNDGADGTSPSTSTSSMQDPTEDDEAPDPECDLNGAGTMRRKVAKKTLPFDITMEELRLINKLRLEKTLTTDEGARKTASLDVSLRLSPPAADGDIDDANADSVTDTQPNAGASTRATRRSWASEEDAKLTRAVADTSKKRCGKEYTADWVEIALLVPGRTNKQCTSRWDNVLNPSIDRAAGRTGKWLQDEDSKLRDAIQRHGGKDWGAISALVPGRTKKQCSSRWHDVLDPRISGAGGRTGRWTAIEDSKLKDAVETHGDNDWVVISALVPGRTKRQCSCRWHDVLDPSIALTAGRKGKWTAVEDNKLKDSVQTRGGKNWVAISALIPGRTRHQCCHRWHHLVSTNIDRENGRTGKWAEDEDSKLRDAVQRHGGKEWGAISALVPGRTKRQCSSRWHDVLNPGISGASGRTGRWTAVEDSKLKDAVQTYGGKNWEAIAALVPGRTKRQCLSRWHDVLDPNIDGASERTGKWTAVEDSELKDAVQRRGDKDWVVTSALVQGRTKKQCRTRWHDALNPSIALTAGRKGKWTAVEDNKLKDAVQTHGAKNWEEISALILGQTRHQCCHRWHHVYPNIDQENGRTGKWTEDDERKLSVVADGMMS